MMRPKKSVNELEESLRESTPPATAVPPHFRQQLRQDLQAQAAAITPSALSRRWLLAPVALLVLVIVAFWYSVPKTAVEPALEINTTRPVPTPAPVSLSQDEIIQKALLFAGRADNKPIGGRLIEPTSEAITITTTLESYDVAMNRLGSFAVADFHGSNIIFTENRAETVWFVQLIGRWQPFGETEAMIESSRYVAVLVNPDTGRIVGAGSSTVPFVREPVVLSLADYPPQERPYFVDQEDGFWLVHTGSQLLAFDPRSPYLPDLLPGQPWPERCLYEWVEGNGRFTGPCSGDEWELDGTLNLTESTELGNNRNLDQYRVEIDGDAISVHLDEIIFSDVIDLESLGTLAEPQTDFDTIIEHLNKLAERRQAFLTSQTGWLYTSTEEFVPLEQRGNDGMIRALFPTEQMMLENWYHTVGDGRYDQLLGRYFDANGNLTQAIVIRDGRSLNLTLNEIDNMSPEAMTLPNEAAYVAQQMANSFIPDTVAAQAYIQTVDGRNHYFLQVNTGSERKYIFDWDNGRLLSQETTFIAASGERIVNYHANYLQEVWHESLPDEAATQLAEGQAILDDPEQATGSYTWDAPAPTPNSNPQPALASATLYSVTFSVQNMESENGVTLTTMAQVAPMWAMDVNAFPPQQALTYITALTDEAGRPFTSTQSTGQLAEMDVITGGIKQGYTHYFLGELIAGEGLVLTAAVDLSNIHRVITLPISLADAEIGQTWALDWQLPVGEARLTMTEVTWLSHTDSGEAQLRLKVVDSSPTEIDIYCLHIARNDPWRESCANFEGEKEYTLTVPFGEPIVLHLRVNVAVRGFELHWQPS